MSAEIVGRERELAIAESFLENLTSGACALLIEGEAGIGKTAIWRAATDRARDRGCRVLSCHAEQAEAHLSFVGLGDLVGETADEVLPILPRTQRKALELALLRDAPPETLAPEPRAVAMGLTSLLAALARAQPVVIAVDDLQWLDAATGQLLAFAIRRLDGSPVGLLATMRTPAGSTILSVSSVLLAKGSRAAASVPSALETVRSLLSARLGREYSRPVLLRIMESCAGNPLFALEIARALGPRTKVGPGELLPVPESLRESIALRISGLAPTPGRHSSSWQPPATPRPVWSSEPPPLPVWLQRRRLGWCGSSRVASSSATRCMPRQYTEQQRHRAAQAPPEARRAGGRARRAGAPPGACRRGAGRAGCEGAGGGGRPRSVAGRLGIGG